MAQTGGGAKPRGEVTAKVVKDEAVMPLSGAARTWVTARLDGKAFTLNVTAAAPYVGREATATVEVTGEDAQRVKALLGEIVEAYQAQAERQAQIAAARALTVAVDQGEV